MHFIQTLQTNLVSVLQELGKNRLRSFLSLFGITIGVFCIISVLATVNSLELNIRSEMKTFGQNTIYVDKWEYSASGPDYPYWKYVKRPEPKFNEVALIKEKTPSAKHVAFKINSMADVQYQQWLLKNRLIYGLSEEFHLVQPFELAYGQYFTPGNFLSGAPVGVIGYETAEQLFGTPNAAINKHININGKKLLVIGVVKKQGRQLLGGWEFDRSVISTYRFARTIMNELKADPLILVQAKDNLNNSVLKEDLTGTLRMLHSLKPREENDFSLNDINDFGAVLTKTFRSINIAGWAIGTLSFIVGIFGVANIMFVSVKERTTQIGIKKAIGAKRNDILKEFLLESAILCLIGGLIGVLLVFVLTQVATHALHFKLFLSPPIMATAFLLSLTAGLIAGVWPARQAARLNPIVAIRS